MRCLLVFLFLSAFTTATFAQKSKPVFTFGLSTNFKDVKKNIGDFEFYEKEISPSLHVGLTLGRRWEAGLFGGVVHNVNTGTFLSEKGFTAGGYGRYNAFMTNNGKLKLYTGVVTAYESRSNAEMMFFCGNTFLNERMLHDLSIGDTRDFSVYAHLGLQYAPFPRLNFFTEFGHFGQRYRRQEQRFSEEIVTSYEGLAPLDLRSLRLGAQWYFRKKS